MANSSRRHPVLPILWFVVLALGSASLVQGRTRTFLLAGQSNMNGYGAAAEVTIPSEVPSVAVWSGLGGRGEVWASLGPGFGVNDMSFGPEVGLGTTLADAFPDDTIALIKTAVPSTSLAVDWLPPSLGGPGHLFSSLLEWLRRAYAQWPMGDLPPVEGVFWMQGESDGTDLSWANAYQERLAALIRDIRDVQQDSLLPWVVGLIDSQATWPYCATIRNAQRNIATSMSHVGLIDTKGLPTDQVHYLAEGQLELGRRLAWRWLVLNGYRVDTTSTDSVGQDTVVVDTTGIDSVGQDTVRLDTTGIDSVGQDTVRLDTTGVDSVGQDTVGVDTTGTDTAGSDTTSIPVEETPRIPVSVLRHQGGLPEFPAGTRLQWVRPDGGGVVEWTQGRGGAPDFRRFPGSMGIVIARFPDGRRELRRVPPIWRR